MKNLNTYIIEKYNTDSIEEYLESIVDSAKSKPDIWDDSESWEARDAFEDWESAWGERDDVKELRGRTEDAQSEGRSLEQIHRGR